MRRLLVVSPYFPPANTADMQRARIALPHLRAVGWEPVVLAVTPESVEGVVLEPLLEETYPSDIRIIRVRGIPPKLTRRFGLGSLWWRCGRALRRAGEQLLAQERFDLVFITTTQFDAFGLGPRWLKRFGVPYVLDYQDPWINDYYARNKVRPPGGYLKFALTQFLARRREPRAVLQAAAIISVSADYGPALISRYPALRPENVHHIPFGAAVADLEIARAHRPIKPLVPANDGRKHFVYTGRCGHDMATALRLLFAALARYRQSHPERAANLVLHFIGTDYAPPPLGRHWVKPLAEEAGVAEQVEEHPYRVPYFDALSYLVQADALLVVGSDDPSYSASKIYPCLLARRPLLTIAQRQSLMLSLTARLGIRTSYGFEGSEGENESIIRKIYTEWFVNEGYDQVPDGDLDLLRDGTAQGMTRRLTSVFDEASAAPRIFKR